jgi:hypothetical protein
MKQKTRKSYKRSSVGVVCVRQTIILDKLTQNLLFNDKKRHARICSRDPNYFRMPRALKLIRKLQFISPPHVSVSVHRPTFSYIKQLSNDSLNFKKLRANRVQCEEGRAGPLTLHTLLESG